MGFLSKPASSGSHGGGHKARDRGAKASDRRAASRATNAKLQAKGKNTDGKKGKPSGK